MEILTVDVFPNVSSKPCMLLSLAIFFLHVVAEGYTC
jgi:hypothetical protein